MKTFIYTLECPITHKIIYVGKTINVKERYSKHCHPTKRNSGKKIYSYLKYLKNNQLSPIMDIIDEIDDIEWNWLERYWISQFKTWGFNLLNTTDGGEKQYHYRHSEETKLIISKKQIGRKLSKEWSNNISKGKTGIQFTESHKKNLSLSHQNISNVDTFKPIYQLDNKFNIINKFDSITLALKYLHKNIKSGIISKVCKGSLKSAYGYYWCYQTDYSSMNVNKFIKNKERKIVKIDINNNCILNTYDNMKLAANDNKCHYTTISHVCNNQKGSVNGFIFLFEDDYSIELINQMKNTVRKHKNGTYWNCSKLS